MRVPLMGSPLSSGSSHSSDRLAADVVNNHTEAIFPGTLAESVVMQVPMLLADVPIPLRAATEKQYGVLAVR
eukprot:SAG31_NODE_39250_length_289_cov_2.352632_1_plen_71_part_01